MSDHPIFKLGKGTAERDSRNLLMSSIVRKVTLPKEYSVDASHPGVGLGMFANDKWGCCVISARAHQTRRFEWLEQGKVLPITDREVVNEYLRESGGQDEGLIMLQSLKSWRTDGWLAAGKRYKIKAFAQIAAKNAEQLKQTVYADVGAMLGLRLPISAQAEINAGKPWSKTTGTGSTAGSWGGHCVYCEGYTTVGPMCITWGQKQQLTWAFYNKYADENYAILDTLNTAKKKKLIDVKAVDNFLESL